MGGFKKFILRGNIVELAVAVIVGATFSGLVQALIADLITPLIGAITGERQRLSRPRGHRSALARHQRGSPSGTGESGDEC
ncbi:MscL family protein [Nonomuraea sp. NPDC046570]|uniref:MscL family protein n=1 Tax=Nonomuraea sp. NPDC046570 TaxID=3155255 RepID=UPI0033CFAE19